jgi:dihydrofolate synthase/folylpolyglutamate synthase
MTYAETIEFLYGLRLFGTKLGLANTVRLAELAGSPHQRLRFIHVAGTNGKGSVCAMLESIYRESGLRTGLFTSPHLVEFGERIQVNRQPIPQADIVRLVEKIRAWIRVFPAEEHPTFFEVVTILALLYFEEQGCELVIWETGMGGRLDATNIVTPLASVITNIHYDHQKWLGTTLEAIAAEKAGIIKPRVPVFTATEAPEALEIIRSTALDRGCACTVVSPADAEGVRGSVARLPLPGAHQRLNAALALAVVNGLQAKLPVSEQQGRDGLAQVQWAGRQQLVRLEGGRLLLLDGAHNIAGVETLAAGIREAFGDDKPCLILGMLQDKDWRQMCHRLAPVAGRIFLVPVASDRTAGTADLAAACRALGRAQVSEFASLAAAWEAAACESRLVIAGSLYLVGEAMELLRLISPRSGNERGLNEWGAAPPPNSPTVSDLLV